jgi:hypothetical protein
MDNAQGIKTNLLQFVHETLFLEAVEARYALGARNAPSRQAHFINVTGRWKRMSTGMEWRQFHGFALLRLLNT